MNRRGGEQGGDAVQCGYVFCCVIGWSLYTLFQGQGIDRPALVHRFDIGPCSGTQFGSLVGTMRMHVVALATCPVAQLRVLFSQR